MVSQRVLGLFASNFLSSVGIVLLNKHINQAGFSAPIALTAIHFSVTFLYIVIAAYLSSETGSNIFGVTRKNFALAFFVSVLYGVSVAVLNTSLRYNSVGMYQLFKVMTTPTVVFCEAVFFKTFPSGSVLSSLLLICVGVGIATVTDMDVRPFGLLIGVLGFITAGLYQTLVKKVASSIKQDKIVAYQCLVSVGFLIPASAMLENHHLGSTASQMSSMVALILLSSSLAIAVNKTTVGIITEVSALGYNVFGHSKTVTIILSGSILFGEKLTAVKAFGSVLALFGAFLYTQIQTSRK